MLRRIGQILSVLFFAVSGLFCAWIIVTHDMPPEGKTLLLILYTACISGVWAIWQIPELTVFIVESPASSPRPWPSATVLPFERTGNLDEKPKTNH
jgi:hypothetical protein